MQRLNVLKYSLFILTLVLGLSAHASQIVRLNQPNVSIFADYHMAEVLTHGQTNARIYLLPHEQNNGRRQYVQINSIRGWVATKYISTFTRPTPDTFERRKAILQYLKQFPFDD